MNEFLKFRWGCWKYKLFYPLFSTSFNSLTEVHVSAASNGRRERMKERQVGERGEKMHTLTNSFLLWTRKLAVFLLVYEEPKNVPCCQGNSCSLGSCNRKEARAIFIGSSLFYHQILERKLEMELHLFQPLWELGNTKSNGACIGTLIGSFGRPQACQNESTLFVLCYFDT